MKLEDLLKVKVFSIGEDEYESTLQEDLEIKSENIEEINVSLANQAKLVTMYGFAYEHALAVERELESQLTRMYAALDYHTRANGKAANIKYTEKMVENEVVTNPDYVDLQKRHLEAKVNAGLLRAALKGMEQRKDAAVTIAHNLRSEMKNNNYE